MTDSSICSKNEGGSLVPTRLQSVRVQTEVNIESMEGVDSLVCVSLLNPGTNGAEIGNKRIVEKINEQANFCQSFIRTREAPVIVKE